ncbi:pilus assembly protein TadG-related protein [Actinocorallia lasiicapitis]
MNPAGRFPSRDDRGTFSAFTAIFSLSVLLFAGLLVDGGMAIHGRQRAFDIAEQSARAGADAIDVETLRETGEIQLLGAGVVCERMNGIVEMYEKVAVAECVPGRAADEAGMHVEIQVNPIFLSIIGLGPFTAKATAYAHPEDGE